MLKDKSVKIIYHFLSLRLIYDDLYFFIILSGDEKGLIIHAMMICKKKEFEHISRVLTDKYKTPKLYLNHCSGDKATAFFDKEFGKKISKPMHVGDFVEIE